MKIRQAIDLACIPGMLFFIYYGQLLFERNEPIAGAVFFLISFGCEARLLWLAWEDGC